MAAPTMRHDDQIENQSPPFSDVNLFTSDTALQEAVVREGAGHAVNGLRLSAASPAARPHRTLGGSPMSRNRGCAATTRKGGASTTWSFIPPTTG